MKRQDLTISITVIMIAEGSRRQVAENVLLLLALDSPRRRTSSMLCIAAAPCEA